MAKVLNKTFLPEQRVFRVEVEDEFGVQSSVHVPAKPGVDLNAHVQGVLAELDAATDAALAMLENEGMAEVRPGLKVADVKAKREKEKPNGRN